MINNLMNPTKQGEDPAQGSTPTYFQVLSMAKDKASFPVISWPSYQVQKNIHL